MSSLLLHDPDDCTLLFSFSLFTCWFLVACIKVMAFGV